MAKAVILKTNYGVKLMGSWQCFNGAYWNADGCFYYCNSEESESRNQHQATKLLYQSTTLGMNPKTNEDWYKYRENFVDVEIPFDDVDQSYIWDMTGGL